MAETPYWYLEKSQVIESFKTSDNRKITMIYNGLKELCRLTMSRLIFISGREYRDPKSLVMESYNDAFLILQANAVSGKLTAEHPGNSVNYFYGILRNVFRNKFRLKYNKWPAMLLDEDREMAGPSASQDFPDLNLNDPYERILRKCIEQLDEKPRQFMKWVHIESKPDEEIVKLTGYTRDYVAKMKCTYNKMLFEKIILYFN